MRRAGSAPLRVKLVATASAKSHRPEHLFAPDTCPIISSGSLGELFVKGTPEGLNRLEHQITLGMSDRITKELSSVDAIEPITPSLRRHNTNALEILRHSPKRDDAFLTRVRLFDWAGMPLSQGSSLTSSRLARSKASCSSEVPTQATRTRRAAERLMTSKRFQEL